MIDENTAMDEQADFYRGFYQIEIEKMHQILLMAPKLKTVVDIKSDVVVRILCEAGMSDGIVCEFIKGKLTWPSQASPKSRRKK